MAEIRQADVILREWHEPGRWRPGARRRRVKLDAESDARLNRVVYSITRPTSGFRTGTVTCVRVLTFETRLAVAVATSAGVLARLLYLSATTPQPGNQREGRVVHVADPHQIEMQLQWVAGERVTAGVFQPPHVGRPKMT